MKRRAFLATSAVSAAVVISGCLDEDNANNGDLGDTVSSTGASSSQEETCRIVERTREDRALDELDTFSAGEFLTARLNLDRGDRLSIEARQVGDGARPALEVEDPHGATIADIGPSERINRRITAEQDGEYYVIFENEATLTSGQWDLTIDAEIEYEEEVCD